MARDSGFGLLEAIVALIVLGLTIVAVFDLVIEGSTRRARSADRLNELLFAKSIVARVGQDLPARPGRQSVRSISGQMWSIEITTMPGLAVKINGQTFKNTIPGALEVG